MPFTVVVSCGPNQIVSRGRLVCRCYRRLNAAQAFGREPGTLACIGCDSRRTPGGGMDYLITLVDVADLTSARQTNGESADFGPLAPEWTPETALPPAEIPQLDWTPSSPEGGSVE